ncbi:hypothetical protein SCUP234_02267 [Seiridium cupressi]
MASRPRRAAAQKANTAITDMVDSDNITSSRTGKIMSSRAQSRRSEGKTAVATITRGPPSSPPESNQHIHVTVKLPASKLRQATSSRTGQSGGRASLSSRENFEGGEIIEGKRNRNQKKSYVVESSDDDDDDDSEGGGGDVAMADISSDSEDDAEGEIVVDDSMDLDVDAEGEDDDDLGDEDAEGEEDDITLDVTPVAPTIKVSKPATSKSTATSKGRSATRPVPKQVVEDENSDDELSELDSEDDEIQDTVKVGGGDDDEEDAEGEEDDEIEGAGAPDQDDEEDEELLSDEDGSRAATPDLTKMTKRQRARFEDDHNSTLLKLSDEVQAKKHFTAEELSMRRAEMARRRRNLSEKRNEEVKRETIDKLLKKQAPKLNRKAQLAAEEAAASFGAQKPDPVFVRWINNKDGSRVAVPDEMLAGPVGRVFIPGGLKSGKMVEEVS